MSLQMPSFGFSSLKNKFWKKKSLTITEYDPVYKVVYLGNVLTPWAKGENCVEKPLATLWKNYCANVKHEIYMKLTICSSGLKAITREHGLTEYWANRITYCYAHPKYPKVFCWVYRHEGRKMKQELRCHAVLCQKDTKAAQMALFLTSRLTTALQEFRREKRMRQNMRESLANACQEITSFIPIRKKHLVKGLANFRPPLERSKSAPKLTSIDEMREEDEEEEEEDEDGDDDDEDDVDDEEAEMAYLAAVRHRKGGSVTSDGQDTLSDMAFSDDLDSLSEQLHSSLGVSSGGVTVQHHHVNNAGASFCRLTSTGATRVTIESTTTTATSNNQTCLELEKVYCDPAFCQAKILKSISESHGDDDEELDEDEEEEQSVSAESGYSESSERGDSASSSSSSSTSSSTKKRGSAC